MRSKTDPRTLTASNRSQELERPLPTPPTFELIKMSSCTARTTTGKGSRRSSRAPLHSNGQTARSALHFSLCVARDMRNPVSGNTCDDKKLHCTLSEGNRKSQHYRWNPVTLTRESAQNQRHEARTTPSPALCQNKTRPSVLSAPPPDWVGVRHRCRARETSSRASRADITSSTTSIATGNDVPHAKRHLCPS